MLCGGTESAVTPLAIGGFTSMKALCTSTDPDRASIPFDAERSGFVMGEGAGILVLEEYSHAVARGAKIYAELLGYGATCDAYHMTRSPGRRLRRRQGHGHGHRRRRHPAGGCGLYQRPRHLHPLERRRRDRRRQDGVRPHAYELAISSTKSMTGHMLGAAGAVEAVLSAMTLHDGFIPATIHYAVPDPECDLDVVPNTGREKDVHYALSNSLALAATTAAFC